MKQLESKLQQACVKWFRLQYPNDIIFAVPNGGSRNLTEAVRLKSEGVLAGVSDLIILFDNKILFVEMKHGKGKQTESQLMFEKKVNAKGFEYIVANSLDVFIEKINHFKANCYL